MPAVNGGAITHYGGQSLSELSIQECWSCQLTLESTIMILDLSMQPPTTVPDMTSDKAAWIYKTKKGYQ